MQSKIKATPNQELDQDTSSNNETNKYLLELFNKKKILTDDSSDKKTIIIKKSFDDTKYNKDYSNSLLEEKKVAIEDLKTINTIESKTNNYAINEAIANKLDTDELLKSLSNTIKNDTANFIARLKTSKLSKLLAQSAVLKPELSGKLSGLLQNHSQSVDLLKSPTPDTHSLQNNFRLTHGPLPKSEETKILENIIKRILQGDSFSFEFNKELQEIYIIDPKQNTKLNLSILLKKSNLSHLIFEEDDISDYSHYLIKYQSKLLTTLNKEVNFSNRTGLFADLPIGLAYALTIYTHNFEISKFLNGVFLEEQHADIKFILLTACFTAAALNQLIILQSEKIYSIVKKLIDAGILIKEVPSTTGDIKKVFIPFTKEVVQQAFVQGVITAEEQLTLQNHLNPDLLYRSDDMDWYKYSGTASLFQQSAFASTTYKKEFMWKNRKFLFYANNLAFMPSIEELSFQKMEHETLIPAGHQVIVQSINGSDFAAMLANTPAIKSALSYQVSVAVRYAFTNYLKNEYGDKGFYDESINLNGQIIYRSNHGLPHTLRQIFYIDSIIDYFATHAADPQFSNYCQSITAEENEYIKIATVFLVTGRNSECGFKDNPKKYIEYRQQSAEHFCDYAKKINMPTEWIERLKVAIFYMGKPDFIESLKQDRKEKYSHKDTYVFHILTMTHKLDLLRCYNATAYIESLQIYNSSPLVQTSPAQQASLAQLTAYATNCINTTGDRLMCCYSVKRQMIINTHHSYRDHFLTASTNPRRCEDFLEQVPPPHLLLADSISTNSTTKEVDHDVISVKTLTT